MTGKQRAFIEAYLADIKRNRTAAAIAAGYSEKTARQAAYGLMQNEEVAAAIAEREKELHEQNTAKAEEVEEFLTSVMRGEEVDNLPLLIRKGVQKFTEGKPPARDRIKAAELLGKKYGLFTDNVNLDTDGVVQIIDDIPRSDDDE